MSDDFEDLLADSGGPSKPARKPRRGKRTIYDEAKEDKILLDDLPMTSDFLRPVGISFLAEIMGKQPAQIRKRLAKCPTVGQHEVAGKPQPIYDFVTAMSFLIEPKGNIEDWFASKNAASLPPYVNKMFWDSAYQRNRVMRSSGDLWHTEDVLAILGRVALAIKEESQLWIEYLPERDNLSDEQYQALTNAVYRLQDTVRERMMNFPTENQTHAMSETIREELTEAGTLPDHQNEGG